MRTATKIIAGLSIAAGLAGGANAVEAKAEGAPEITGTRIADFSSQHVVFSWNCLAVHAIDGSGLAETGTGERVHRVHGRAQRAAMWRAGKLPARISVDLGSYYDLEQLHVWNYPGKQGAKQVQIWVAPAPDAEFIQLDGDAGADGVQPFMLGEVDSESTGETVDLRGQRAADNVRLVRLVIVGNHSDNVAGGLAEVQFRGTELADAAARNQALEQRRNKAEQFLAAVRRKLLDRERAAYKKMTVPGRPDLQAFDEFNQRRLSTLEARAKVGDISSAIVKLWLHVDSEMPDFWKDKSRDVLEKLAADHTAVQHPDGDIWGELARFCLDKNIEEANRIVMNADLKRFPWHAHFDLIGLYDMFNADDGVRGRLLSREATDKLQEHMLICFDPETRAGYPWRMWHFAPEQPWQYWGNQNHGFAFQSFFYGAANILKDIPEYAERFDPVKVPWGQGLSEDTDPELAKISLAEFAERGRRLWRNRLLWMASRGVWAEDVIYRSYSVEVLYHFVNNSTDPVIRKRAAMMLDLHWLMYAQQTVHGQFGGAQNRFKNHYHAYHPERAQAGYYFGKLVGAENGSSVNAGMANYLPPAIAYELLANPEKRGSFTYKERLTMFSPEPEQPPRTYKQSYVTPEYVLGSYVCHDLANTSHRYAERAFNGITFGKARAILRLLPNAAFVSYHFMQHGPILLGRWYGTEMMAPGDPWRKRAAGAKPGLAIIGREGGGAEIETPVLENGWVFGKAGDAYYALRPAEGEFSITNANNFAFPEDKLKIPFIIHAGGATEDGSFEEFKERILRNKISYKDGVLTYKTQDWGAMRFCPDPAKPADQWRRIKGWFTWKTVELPDKLFDSPYLNSAYDSGIITADFGDHKLVLDFNKNERRSE